jgi:hypothetical protein
VPLVVCVILPLLAVDVGGEALAQTSLSGPPEPRPWRKVGFETNSVRFQKKEERADKTCLLCHSRLMVAAGGRWR